MSLKNIYLVSYSPYSGKTAFALGLALCLQDEGINVGYFKPISVGTEIRPSRFLDEDVILIRSVLGLKESVDEISPPINVRIGTAAFAEKVLEDREYFRNRIIDAYNKIKDKYDFLIIEGRHQIQSLFAYRLDSISLSKLFDSKILVLSRGNIDDLLLLKTLIEAMNAKLLGTAFNNIRTRVIRKIEAELRPIMERFKINFYGFIPENKTLNSPSIREYHQALGGQILVGKEYMSNLVESAHIGAMRTESALKVLKRFRNYALITGGDRSDLIYRVLQTDIALLILTGNLYPDVKILVEAEERKVPVLLVPHETAVTYNICWTVTAGLSPSQKDKIELVKTLIKDHINWKQIYADA